MHVVHQCIAATLAFLQVHDTTRHDHPRISVDIVEYFVEVKRQLLTLSNPPIRHRVKYTVCLMSQLLQDAGTDTSMRSRILVDIEPQMTRGELVASKCRHRPPLTRVISRCIHNTTNAVGAPELPSGQLGSIRTYGDRESPIHRYSSILEFSLSLSVGVRELHVAIFARSSREMSQTVRIV